jgi:6-pyruvoyltetrahydropterin/6-carboxytetrahydropterin synthase
MIEVHKSFSFEAAHRLPRVPAHHKCSRMHGHSFRAEICVAGDVDPETGMLIDFAVISEAMAPLLSRLDHQVLNDIPGLENPTSEVLAQYLFDQLSPKLDLSRITVYETATSGATYSRASKFS